MDRGPPDRRIGRSAKLFDRVASGRPEAQKNLCESLAYGSTFFDRQRFGERFEDGGAGEVQQRVQLLGDRVVYGSQMRDDVRHHRPVHQAGQCAVRRRFSGAVAFRLFRKDARQLNRRVEIAHQQAIFDVADDRRHHRLPALRIRFDRQQIEQQPQVERAHFGRADR